MLVLALDSSQIVAQVALLRLEATGATIVASAQGAAAISQSQSLLPLIDDVLKQGKVELPQLGALAAGVGPGSFTGLRIGLATARSMAQALNLSVVGFSSLRCLVHSFGKDKGRDIVDLVAVVDAYQGQVFAGWQQQAGAWAEAWAEDSVTPQDLVERLRKAHNADSFVLVGNGTVRYAADFTNAQIPAEKLSSAQITADGLAAATAEAHKAHGLQDLEALIPRYMRPSAADLNLAAALQKG